MFTSTTAAPASATWAAASAILAASFPMTWTERGSSSPAGPSAMATDSRRWRGLRGAGEMRTNSVHTRSRPPRAAISDRKVGWLTPSMGARTVLTS